MYEWIYYALAQDKLNLRILHMLEDSLLDAAPMNKIKRNGVFEAYRYSNYPDRPVPLCTLIRLFTDRLQNHKIL